MLHFIRAKKQHPDIGDTTTAEKAGLATWIVSRHFHAMKQQPILVKALGGHAGQLEFAGLGGACALGAAGVTRAKREGDNATPIGGFALRRIWYRKDRWKTPVSPLPIREISETCAWSDDVHDPHYNQAVDLPYTPSHELLWRQDGLYNVFFELGYNDAPAIAGKGSAIFLHLQKNDFQPTRGCIAVDETMMQHIIDHAGPQTKVEIAD